jgi:hypothetical protein
VEESRHRVRRVYRTGPARAGRSTHWKRIWSCGGPFWVNGGGCVCMALEWRWRVCCATSRAEQIKGRSDGNSHYHVHYALAHGPPQSLTTVWSHHRCDRVAMKLEPKTVLRSHCCVMDGVAVHGETFGPVTLTVHGCMKDHLMRGFSHECNSLSTDKTSRAGFNSFAKSRYIGIRRTRGTGIRSQARLEKIISAEEINHRPPFRCSLSF